MTHERAPGSRVEVRATPGAVLLSAPGRPALEFTPAAWAAFVAAVRAGAYGIPAPGPRGPAAVPDCLRPIELQDHPLRGRRPHRRP